jgi:hypothetical protein
LVARNVREGDGAEKAPPALPILTGALAPSALAVSLALP